MGPFRNYREAMHLAVCTGSRKTMSQDMSQQEGASEVFDLDQAIHEDTAGEPFRFTFHGEDYQVPAGADMERIVRTADSGDPDGALRSLLGGVQCERLMARPDAAQVFRCLRAAYLEHQGG